MAARLRALLKPFAVTPRFGSRAAAGIAPLFTALEAHKGAVVLTEGITASLPPGLVVRPFTPALDPVIIMVGTASERPQALHARLRHPHGTGHLGASRPPAT